MPFEWRLSLLSQMAAEEGVLVGEILEVTPAEHKQGALRTLGWLYKTGLVRLGEFPS